MPERRLIFARLSFSRNRGWPDATRPRLSFYYSPYRRGRLSLASFLRQRHATTMCATHHSRRHAAGIAKGLTFVVCWTTDATSRYDSTMIDRTCVVLSLRQSLWMIYRFDTIIGNIYRNFDGNLDWFFKYVFYQNYRVYLLALLWNKINKWNKINFCAGCIVNDKPLEVTYF